MNTQLRDRLDIEISRITNLELTDIQAKTDDVIVNIVSQVFSDFKRMLEWQNSIDLKLAELKKTES